MYVTYDAKLFAYVGEFTKLPKVKNSILNYLNYVMRKHKLL